MDYLLEILRARVYDVAIETPLQMAPLLSYRLSNRVHLKREDKQPVKSFKLRGAYNLMAQLDPEQRQRGVICASAGNHAQGVALAANKLDCRAIIVMPKTTAPVKLEAVRAWGGPVDVVLHGDTFADALAHARQLEAERGLVFVHPYDDPRVIAGQGTIGMEILRQLSEPIHAIFVAVGGGGMIAGIAAYVKLVRPEVRIVGVQTVDSNSMALSLSAGRPTPVDDVGLFADGTAIKLVGTETFRLAQLYVDEIIQVTTDQICAAIKDVFLDTRSILEPSGAMSVAGAKLYCQRNAGLRDAHLVCVACGANINFDRLRFIVERAELGQARLLPMAIRLTAERGPLMALLAALPRPSAIHDLTVAGPRVLLGVSVADADEAAAVKVALSSFAPVDLTTNEYAKAHARYLIGGVDAETVVRFEFRERAGALYRLLERIDGASMPLITVHYSSSGGDLARVLVGVGAAPATFLSLCQQIGSPYRYYDETDNPAHRLFQT